LVNDSGIKEFRVAGSAVRKHKNISKALPLTVAPGSSKRTLPAAGYILETEVQII